MGACARARRWGERGLAANAKGPVSPVTATRKGLYRLVSRKVKDSPNQGPTAKPKEAGLRENLRARLRPTAQACGHLPPAGPAQSAVEDYSLNMAASRRWWRGPATRGARPLTRDVKETQPLGLQGGPRGQLIPVPLHGDAAPAGSAPHTPAQIGRAHV